MKLLLSAIALLTLFACSHLKYGKYRDLCDRDGTPQDCGKAGYYAYQSGKEKEGIDKMSEACFVRSHTESCFLFRRVAPDQFSSLKSKLDKERMAQTQREAEAAERAREVARIESEKRLAQQKQQVEIDCRGMVKAKYAESYDNCISSLGNEDFEACRSLWTKGSSDAYTKLEKCVWAQENPIAAHCEKQVKLVGGDIWTCVGVIEARNAREDAETLQRQQHSDKMRLESERMRLEAADRERQIELETERQRQQKIKDASDSIRKAFTPPSSTSCTSRKIGGTLQTDCTSSP